MERAAKDKDGRQNLYLAVWLKSQNQKDGL